MISFWGKISIIKFNQQVNVFYRDSSGSESNYEALAVIEHKGEMTSDGDSQGHYICDVKCNKSKAWYRTNNNMKPCVISTKNVTNNGVVILYRRK